MNEKPLNDQIIDFLQEASSPMTLDSIAENFDVSQYRATRSLDELMSGGKIIEIIPENKPNGRKYYTVGKEKPEDTIHATYSKAEKTIVQETVNIKDNYKDLDEKIEQINKNVNGLYANIIAIMSVFVCIFALITVNANITFQLTQENMQGIFVGIVVVNILIVACIIALLVGIRVILINPLIGKGKKAGKGKW